MFWPESTTTHVLRRFVSNLWGAVTVPQAKYKYQPNTLGEPALGEEVHSSLRNSAAKYTSRIMRPTSLLQFVRSLDSILNR